MRFAKHSVWVLGSMIAMMAGCAAPTEGDEGDESGASGRSEAAVSPVGENLVGDESADLQLRLCYDRPVEGGPADGTCSSELPPVGTDGSPGGPQKFVNESDVAGQMIYFSVRALHSSRHMNEARGLVELDRDQLALTDITIQKVGGAGHWHFAAPKTSTRPFWPSIFNRVGIPADAGAATYRVTVTVLKGGQVRGFVNGKIRESGWSAAPYEGWWMIGSGVDDNGDDELNRVNLMATWQNPTTMDLVVANARRVSFDVAVLDNDG